MLLTVEVERRVVVEELLTEDVERVVEVLGETSRVVVGRAGNADVDVFLLCELVPTIVALLDVDAPLTVDVETSVALARRTAEGVVVTRLDVATFVAKREELFTLRRSFSLPRAT